MYVNVNESVNLFKNKNLMGDLTNEKKYHRMLVLKKLIISEESYQESLFALRKYFAKIELFEEIESLLQSIIDIHENLMKIFTMFQQSFSSLRVEKFKDPFLELYPLLIQRYERYIHKNEQIRDQLENDEYHSKLGIDTNMVNEMKSITSEMLFKPKRYLHFFRDLKKHADEEHVADIEEIITMITEHLKSYNQKFELKSLINSEYSYHESLNEIKRFIMTVKSELPDNLRDIVHAIVTIAETHRMITVTMNEIEDLNNVNFKLLFFGYLSKSFESYRILVNKFEEILDFLDSKKLEKYTKEDDKLITKIKNGLTIIISRPGRYTEIFKKVIKYSTEFDADLEICLEFSAMFANELNQSKKEYEFSKMKIGGGSLLESEILSVNINKKISAREHKFTKKCIKYVDFCIFCQHSIKQNEMSLKCKTCGYWSHLNCTQIYNCVPQKKVSTINNNDRRLVDRFHPVYMDGKEVELFLLTDSLIIAKPTKTDTIEVLEFIKFYSRITKQYCKIVKRESGFVICSPRSFSAKFYLTFPESSDHSEKIQTVLQNYKSDTFRKFKTLHNFFLGCSDMKDIMIVVEKSIPYQKMDGTGFFMVTLKFFVKDKLVATMNKKSSYLIKLKKHLEHTYYLIKFPPFPSMKFRGEYIKCKIFRLITDTLPTYLMSCLKLPGVSQNPYFLKILESDQPPAPIHTQPKGGLSKFNFLRPKQQNFFYEGICVNDNKNYPEDLSSVLHLNKGDKVCVLFTQDQYYYARSMENNMEGFTFKENISLI